MEFTTSDILARLKADLKNEDTRIEGSFSMDNLGAVSEELARLNAMRIKPLWDEIETRILEVVTSGNERHYEYWALQPQGSDGSPILGSARAQGVRDGSGVVNIACVAANGTAPDDATLKAVADYIETVRPVGAKPILRAGAMIDINISCTAVITDGADIAVAKTEAATKIREYMARLMLERGGSTLNYYKIVSMLNETSGIKEITDCTVNGGRSSMTGTFAEFFSLKEVTINVAA